MTDLKPCPFCGGTDIRWFTNRVGCWRCMSQTAADTTETWREDCAEAWNTRATLAPSDDLVAAAIYDTIEGGGDCYAAARAVLALKI